MFNYDDEYVPGGETVSIEVLTPEDARELSLNMAPNRNVSEKHFKELVAAIESGDWMVTSQGIGIDHKGRVIDGQHRIRAVIASGQAIKTVIVWGLHPDAIKATDSVRVRRYRDDRKIAGKDKHTIGAAVVRLIAQLEEAVRRDLAASSIPVQAFSRFELERAEKRYEEEFGLEDSMLLAMSAYRQLKIPESAGGAAHYLGCRIYGKKFADDFMDRLASGAGLQKGDPTLALRQRCESLRGMTRDRPRNFVYALAILKAMEDESKGNQLTKFPMSRFETIKVRRYAKTPRS